MSLLSAIQLKLLNAFSNSQPALNDPNATPETSAIKLGDLINSAAAATQGPQGVPGPVGPAGPAGSAAAVGQTVASAGGVIAVAGMTATGAALAFVASTGAALSVTPGVGQITVGAAGDSVAVNWVVIKLS
jgi:hypothetical protein